MGELSIEIAGLRTAILTRDAGVADVVRDRYKGFLSAGMADWQIEISAQPIGGRPLAGEEIGRAHV